jgi:hypothetical protein
MLLRLSGPEIGLQKSKLEKMDKKETSLIRTGSLLSWEEREEMIGIVNLKALIDYSA